MTNTVRIVYIDDKIDNALSRYLDQLSIKDINIQSKEIEFISNTQGYISLLEDDFVKSSNIVIIDSKLFENSDVNEKFTGEEFKMIYTTAHPYSKVIVISQENDYEKYGTREKRDSGTNNVNGVQFYEEQLGDLIRKHVEEIIFRRNILERLKENSEAYKGSLIVEKVDELMLGTSSYKDLTDEKLDSLIRLVENKLKPLINGDE